MNYKKVVPQNTRVEHVVSHNKNNKNVVQKSHHSSISGERYRQITHVMSPPPSEKALHNGSQIKFYLESNTCRIIKSCKLRFKIALSLDLNGNTSTYPQTYNWFDRIEFYIRDTGVEIQRIYSDVLGLFVNSSDEKDESKLNYFVNQSSNYGTITNNVISKRKNYPSEQYFYLPLDASFFSGMDIDLTSISSDIEIRLHPRVLSINQNDALKEVALIIDEIYLDRVSNASHINFVNKHVISHTYLDIQQYHEKKVMSPSSKYTFDLDMFDKKSAGLLVCIKPDNSRDNYCYDLGTGTMDIIDVNGSSLLGGGRAMVYDNYLDNIPWMNNYLKKTKNLLIPFTNPIKALHGILHGYFQFDQSKMKLEITTPSLQLGVTRINFQIRAVLDGTVIGYVFKYKNKRSRLLGFNASNIQIQSNFNELMNEFGYNSTAVTGQFDTNTLVNIDLQTLTNQNIVASDFNGDVPELVIFTNNPNDWQPYSYFANINSSETHWPQQNVNVDIYIYSLQLKIIEQSDGRLNVLDLV